MHRRACEGCFAGSYVLAGTSYKGGEYTRVVLYDHDDCDVVGGRSSAPAAHALKLRWQPRRSALVVVLQPVIDKGREIGQIESMRRRVHPTAILQHQR